MKGEGGLDAVFAPVEVAVGQKLQAVGMFQRALGEPAGQLQDLEAGLDFLDPRRGVAEESVHPAIDAEMVARPLEMAAHRHFRLVQRIGLRPFPLYPDMDLLAVGGRASITRMRFDAAAAGDRQGEIKQGDGDELHVGTQGRQVTLPRRGGLIPPRHGYAATAVAKGLIPGQAAAAM